MNLRICDFFSGLHSWTNPVPKATNKIFSIDNNPDYSKDTTVIMDFLELDSQMIIDHLGGKPDVILASPPCTTFSIASCSKHWNLPGSDGSRTPKSENAIIGLKLLEHTIQLIKELDPVFFFIENPRGLMRKMNHVWDSIEHIRHTVWYCKYGDSRAKPTDIWTNCYSWKPREQCKNGNPECNHIRAPRGSKTGTQGLKGNADRSLIPNQLCEEIYSSYYGANWI